jgi:putative phage-type endonuclease
MRSIKKNISKLTRQEWINLRRDSIGGSDSATILEWTQRSYYELWGDKSGLYEKKDFSNNKTRRGQILEDVVAHMWMHWEKDTETMYKNLAEGKIINRAQKTPYMYYHPKYPFMSANLDRIIIDKKDGRGPGVLECKTTSSLAVNMWKAGVDPAYVCQIQHYMMVTGMKWGEIAMFIVDTGDFEVFKFERDEKIIKTLKEQEIKFWSRVEGTRKAIASRQSYSAFEPNPEHSEAFKDFMQAHFTAEPGLIVEGDENDMRRVLEFKAIKEEIAEKEKELLKRENLLKFKMKSADEMIITDYLSVRWKADKNGKRRFSIKEK